jgi:Flp pilus assembly pilin Flp
MNKSSGGTRFDAVDRVIAASLALLLLAACSKDSTSPTPVPATIAIVSGTSQVATVGTLLSAPVAVKVNDAAGNPVSGVAVTFTPASASGTVSSAQATTDATGSAQVTWTLGTLAGTDSLMITAGTLTPLAVSATAMADAPSAIAIVSGNDQSAPVDSTLSGMLAVKVTDQYGNVVPNAVVQWSNDSGGSLSATTTVTDSNGVAQVMYTLGATAGAEDVVATLINVTTAISTSFTEIGN